MLRKLIGSLSGGPSTAPRAPGACAVRPDAPAGSRRHLARAAGGEWRAHCALPARGVSTLDGGLDRTSVRIWSDPMRALQPAGPASRGADRRGGVGR